MKSWKNEYAAILVAETLAIAGFATSMPIVPLYLQDLGVTDPAALKFWSGIIQSAASVTLAVFAPIWGSLADSYGRRLMLLRAMFGGAAVVGLMALTTNPWQLLALRALQGCLTGTVAAATVMVAGLSPAARVGFALGLLQTGVSVGNSLGPLVGGVVSDFLGRKAAFLATSAMLVAAGAIVLRFVRKDERRLPEGAKPRIAPDFKAVTGNPVLLALMAVVFALQAASALGLPIMPLFIQELVGGRELVGSTTGMVLGAGAAAAALAAALVGRFADGIGYGRTLAACMAGGALLSLPQAFVSTPLQLTLLRMGSMFFLGGAMPAVNALIAANAPQDKQGGIYGLNASVASAGAALGPVVGSSVAAVWDYRAAFPATALILAATTLAVRRGTRRMGPR